MFSEVTSFIMVSFPEVERQMETAMLGVFTAGKRPHSLVLGLHSPKPFQNLDSVRNYEYCFKEVGTNITYMLRL